MRSFRNVDNHTKKQTRATARENMNEKANPPMNMKTLIEIKYRDKLTFSPDNKRIDSEHDIIIWKFDLKMCILKLQKNYIDLHKQ